MPTFKDWAIQVVHPDGTPFTDYAVIRHNIYVTCFVESTTGGESTLRFESTDPFPLDKCPLPNSNKKDEEVSNGEDNNEIEGENEAKYDDKVHEDEAGIEDDDMHIP
jgi:hypothetical protein